MSAEMRTCKVPDCEKASAKGRKNICEMHYYRMRKYGSYDKPKAMSDYPCLVDSCITKAKSRGYCGVHAERIKRYGDPLVFQLDHENPERRFWSYVRKTATCWLWQSTLTWDGYGLFSVKGRRTGAHRFAYEFAVGPIPTGLQLDHLCRVRNCVNPEHLEPVTPAENTRRAALATTSTTCSQGHNRTKRPNGTYYCPTCRRQRYEREKSTR